MHRYEWPIAARPIITLMFRHVKKVLETFRSWDGNEYQDKIFQVERVRKSTSLGTLISNDKDGNKSVKNNNNKKKNNRF